MKRIVLLCLLCFPLIIQADGGKNHRRRLARPIPLGVSGSNARDFTTSEEFITCCGGTLGALVRDSFGRLHVLSNNHVIGRANKAVPGEPVMQPGMIDNNCRRPNTDKVATFTRLVPFQFNNNPNRVDAAMARIVPGKVATNGKIMDIGVPGPPVSAALNMRVKKSGRTSGRTNGIIDALNVTVRVRIPNRCGGNQERNVRFVDQIYIRRLDRPFIKSGDSGSLLLQNRTTCPGTVGLLYAGDDEGNAVANRMQDVLTSLGASLVSCFQTAKAETDLLSLSQPAMIAAAEIQKKYEDRLLRMDGVHGTGLGLIGDHTAIVIFVEKGKMSKIPTRLDQYPVRVISTTGFEAL